MRSETLQMDTALLKPGLRLAVGLSGGADSVALLRALAERSGELGLVLHAAHLHHGLRGAARRGPMLNPERAANPLRKRRVGCATAGSGS